MDPTPLLLFLVVCLVLMLGFPVAFSLAGTALFFALAGVINGTFEPSFLSALPSRLFGIMGNQTLVAVPLFVFMGIMLERSKVADELLESMSRLFGRLRGGLGISVTLVGMLMAASTGIVGATVVTMGVLSLPTMLKRRYNPSFATGTICATGTLGQIIPPSIALVLLGDVLSSAYQQAQLNLGVFAPKTVSVGDLFAGAMVPGLLLVAGYGLYIAAVAVIRPDWAPTPSDQGELEAFDLRQLVRGLIPPLVLIVAVLGSILAGIATPTEAAAVGATGSTILAAVLRGLTVNTVREVCHDTLKVTSMVFFILIGAAVFSLVFRGYGGDELVASLFESAPSGATGSLVLTMVIIFLLGFILDFIEITFVVVPIVGPVLLAMGYDPVWLGVMIAVNLQTSFLTPPFGFALFYLRGVAPESIQTGEIYRGVIPFVIIQLALLALLSIFPELVTWLPSVIYGS